MDVEKKLVVSKLPNMLIIHLQRIVFDMDTFMNTKLNSRIEFPNVLNMQPYMLGEVLKQDQEMLEKHHNMTKFELKKSASASASKNIGDSDSKVDDLMTIDTRVEEPEREMEESDDSEKNKDDADMNETEP